MQLAFRIIKKIVPILLIAMTFISCDDDDSYIGFQEDLTGNWSLNRKTVKAGGQTLPPKDCPTLESIAIQQNGNGTWMIDLSANDCFLQSLANVSFEAIEGGSSNFLIKLDNDFLVQQSGKFISDDQIRITQEIMYNNIRFDVISFYDKQ